MKRVKCVWFPNWPLQRIWYAQPEHKHRPIVLYADTGRNGLHVVTCCPSATRRGIVPGMPLAEARGLTETRRRSQSDATMFIRHCPDDDKAGLLGLAVWCQRFSPFVGIEEPDSLLLDVSGCAVLFGGERPLSTRLTHALVQWGFTVRTAIADTIGAAWAIAHFGKDRMAIIPAAQQKAALRLLPVQSLRLSKATIQTLDELDLRRIEQLQSLPRSSMSSRLAPEVAQRLDQALGTLDERIVPVRPPDPIEANEDFEHSIRDRKTLEIVLQRLIERLAEKMTATQHGVQRLEVRLVAPAKQDTSFVVGTLRPCHSTAHLMELVQTRLEQVVLAGEVSGVRLKVTTTALLESHQNRLFDTANEAGDRRELARLIDRMSNRLGQQRVVHPRRFPDVQPEFSVCWEPLLAPKARSLTLSQTSPGPVRPLRLHAKPLAIQVTSVVPDGPPLRFFWTQVTHTVARCWGPERIETGWWREQHIRRDYYRVETESGQRFWLFRRIGRGDWFLHGEFE